MNIEAIELKAKVAHKHDQLDILINGMPDSLKKRIRAFSNEELRRTGTELIDAQIKKDLPTMTRCIMELEVLGQLGAIQQILPE